MDGNCSPLAVLKGQIADSHKRTVNNLFLVPAILKIHLSAMTFQPNIKDVDVGNLLERECSKDGFEINSE